MRCSNYLRQAKRRHDKVNDLVNNNQWVYSAEDQVVGKDSLASLLEISITCVERWIRDGMPIEQRGDHLHDWIFNIDAVNQWQVLQSNIDKNLSD